MAVIDLIGHAAHAEPARARKPLHPSLYLLMGFAALVCAAMLLDAVVGALF